MSLPSLSVLVNALVRPLSLLDLSPTDWDLLIRQARSADLLARIALNFQAVANLDQIPEPPRRHLESALIVASRQCRELHWEVRQIQAALAVAQVPVVLLKGAAYAIANLACAQGRTMSDVDILVPQSALAAVESALMKRGWISAVPSAYDQRYYRQWMHELPAMRHLQRGTVVDVHHALLPLTCKRRPSSEAILSSAQVLAGGDGIMVLAPADMLLHSATHLFHEGEFDQGFRGLVDIDALLREFDQLNEFWLRLVPRAAELDLVRPLFYALRYAMLVLQTPVPASVMAALAAENDVPKSPILGWFMDALFVRALRPTHHSAQDRWSGLAKWLLYVRGHWLRMPPGLLLRHLTRKALMPMRSTPRADMARR